MLATRPYLTATLAGLVALLFAACLELWLRPVNPAQDDGTRFPATLWNAAATIAQRPGFDLGESLQFRDRDNWIQAAWILASGAALGRGLHWLIFRHASQRDRRTWYVAKFAALRALLAALAGVAVTALVGGGVGFANGMTFVTPDGGGQLPPGAGAAWLGALYALFFAWPLIALAVLLAAFIAARRTWRQLKVAADFSQSP